MSVMNSQSVYALLSANVYGVTNNDENGAPVDRSALNTLPLPGPEWSIVGEQNSSSGFMARAYKNATTGEIVISYAGTTSGIDWVTGNALASVGGLATQVLQACMFYLNILNSPAAQGANITFTGHSLGGGLASLMAVYFNRQATVFDEAPFELAAENPILHMGVSALLNRPGIRGGCLV